LKVDKAEFDKGIESIKSCVQKFAVALNEMDKSENEKIIEAGNWFYQNLNEKLQPLKQGLKQKIELCIDERDYDSVLILLECLKEVDEVQDAVMGLRR
jgi:copper chaperone CopZ